MLLEIKVGCFITALHWSIQKCPRNLIVGFSHNLRIQNVPVELLLLLLSAPQLIFKSEGRFVVIAVDIEQGNKQDYVEDDHNPINCHRHTLQYIGLGFQLFRK